MPYYPIATEVGAVYRLTGPDGSVAVFNDPSDLNYVGMLTEVTGLDSPEIRESAQELVESDGGTHNKFFFGRRPIILSGRVFGHASVVERNMRLDRARRASNAMRADGTLTWTPAGSTVEVFVPVRRQQPFRESGGWVKDFQIPLVSEYAYIYSTVQRVASNSSSVFVTNQGNAHAYPLLRITGGPLVDPTVTIDGVTFTTTDLTLASGETVEFDMLNHTGRFVLGPRANESANRHVNFVTTKWPTIAPYDAGTNAVLGGSGAGSLTVIHRDTWV